MSESHDGTPPVHHGHVSPIHIPKDHVAISLHLDLIPRQLVHLLASQSGAESQSEHEFLVPEQRRALFRVLSLPNPHPPIPRIRVGLTYYRVQRNVIGALQLGVQCGLQILHGADTRSSGHSGALTHLVKLLPCRRNLAGLERHT